MNSKVKGSLISAVIFSSLIYLFAWSSVFSVHSIEVSGLPGSVPPKTIIAQSRIVLGEKLARIEPRAVEKKLSELTWVKEVNLDRHWAHGSVTIAITARTPVGIFQGRALDATGTLFDYPGALPHGLPVVSAANTELGLSAISLFTSLPVDLRDQVLSIQATNESSLSTQLHQAGRTIYVRWGTSRQVALKVSVLKALLALPENQKVTRVDLSAPHAPIVK